MVDIFSPPICPYHKTVWKSAHLPRSYIYFAWGKTYPFPTSNQKWSFSSIRRSWGFFESRHGILNRSRQYWCHSIKNFYIYLRILFGQDQSSGSKVMRRSVNFCQIFESEYLSVESGNFEKVPFITLSPRSTSLPNFRPKFEKILTHKQTFSALPISK